MTKANELGHAKDTSLTSYFILKLTNLYTVLNTHTRIAVNTSTETLSL